MLPHTCLQLGSSAAQNVAQTLCLRHCPNCFQVYTMKLSLFLFLKTSYFFININGKVNLNDLKTLALHPPPGGLLPILLTAHLGLFFGN